MLETIKKRLFARRDPVEEPTVPDPAKRFPHSQNSELFAFLRKSWLERCNLPSVRSGGDYPFLTHPDLIERFRTLAPSPDVMQDSVYGRAIMATPTGIVFAWAGGMNDIFLRLPRSLQQAAVDELGRYDPTYGEDWIDFPAFGSRYGARVNPDETLHRWMRIAYVESLKVSS